VRTELLGPIYFHLTVGSGDTQVIEWILKSNFC